MQREAGRARTRIGRGAVVLWFALALAAVAPAATWGASATSGAATLVRSSTATLNGQVDPSGDPIAQCHFQYVTEAAFGATGFTDLSTGGEAPCSPAPPYSVPGEVSAGISGLAAGTAYRFRIVAVTAAATTLEGAAKTFATVHGEIGSFGSDGEEGGPAFGSFGAAFQLGFYRAGRRLFVPDATAPGIWGFDVSGAASSPPLTPFAAIAGFDPLLAPTGNSLRGIAADNSALTSAGNVYYIASFPSKAYHYDLAGDDLASPGELPSPIESGTAVVDSAGRLWIEGRTGGFGDRLDELTPAGGPPVYSVERGDLPTGLTGLCGIAIGPADELYALTKDCKGVWRLDPASGYREGRVFIESLGGLGGAKGLAFDPRSHHLFVTGEAVIAEYDATGTQVDEFGEGIAGSRYRGIAVDPANHLLYVADANTVEGNVVRVFEAGARFPSFELEDPAPLENTTATLRATVNPEGTQLTQCRFEYVSEEAYEASGFADLASGGEVPCDPKAEAIPADGSDHAVSAAIAGLEAHTTYRYRLTAANGAGPTAAEAGFATPGPPAVQTTGAQLPGPTEALLGGRVNPEGEATEYRFEYGTQGPCGPNPCASTPPVALEANEVQQVRYFGGGTFTLSFEGEGTTAIPFDASGSQVRAALEALGTIGGGSVRVAGGKSSEGPATYTVTFAGALAGTDVGPIGGSSQVGVQTALDGGVGRETKPVAARIGGLSPDTVYHYRLVAENGNPAGASVGVDMTLRTHPASPLGHGELPGPPESDRAYEQVSAPDTGGNPVQFALAFAANGDRAIYQIAGGTPTSSSGTFVSQLFAERREEAPHSGRWESGNIVPREIFEPSAPNWFFFPDSGLHSFIGYNTNTIAPLPGDVQRLWRIGSPTAGPFTPLLSFGAERSSEFFEASDDTSRAVVALEADLDPAHPAGQGQFHLYDVSSEEDPHLLDLLPAGESEAPAACGVDTEPSHRIYALQRFDLGKRHWLSADGRLAFFPSKGDDCGGPTELYVRDIPAGETKPISGPPLSGPECSAAFLRATPGAAFFWTQSRLSAEDAAAPPAGGCEAIPGNRTLYGDVYRYDTGSGGLSCVSCVRAGREADVRISPSTERSALEDIGVAENGAAVYFASPHRLVAGAAREGVYRVGVGGTEDGRLDYVAPGIAQVGDAPAGSAAVSADGGVLVFRSNDPRLDPQGGTTNGGFAQYYRYEQDDRSLACVSCPADGTAPRGETIGLPNFGTGAISSTTTFNGSPLSEDGGVLIFDTPSALVGSDQNTTPQGQNPQHGQDVYEWREGRALLISDGLSDWPGGGEFGASLAAPEPAAVSPDGRDVFFLEAAQLTADALDGYRRLYDARIGGGFAFPEAARECDLEVCQGTAKGRPDLPSPGTDTAFGLGNPAPPAACGTLALRARALIRRAKRVSRHARRAHGAARRRALRRAGRLAAKARKQRKQARRCRRARRARR
jgi:hypothetical protein